MYSVPADFADRLASEFDNRLRIRWSYQEQAFVVEQKVSRRLADAFPVLNDQDDLLRLRDGYIKVMSVNTGTRVPCPRKGCTVEFKLPTPFVSYLMECPECRACGYPYQHAAGFFELTDRLIEHLRSIDPLNGASRRNRDRVDRTNETIEQAMEREANNLLEAAAKDNFTQMAGIQSVGYTGKIFTG
jgi:hypothetical protein